MNIVILRHAETLLNRYGKFCGRINCDITEEGKSETSKLVDIEPFKFGFTAMYVSPLKRTVQTLKAIYPESNYIMDERLIEISLGGWEGLEKNSVNQEYRQAFLKGMYTPPYAMEKHEDVVNRIKSLFKELSETYKDSDSILLVTHNGVIRTIIQLIGREEIKTKNSHFIILDSNDLEIILSD